MLGGVLLTIGFALLLNLTPSSALWVPAATTFVIGLGFGFYSVVIILAAQSSVGWQNRGVVTSANQFARNIGGTVGVSLAGAIFTAGVVSAAGAGVDPNEILSPVVRATLSAADLGSLQQVLAGALRSVYLLFVGVAALATVVAVLLPGGRPSQASEAGSAA